MPNFFDDNFKKNVNGLPNNEKNKFKDNVLGKKASLSDAEAAQFRKIVKENDLKEKMYNSTQVFRASSSHSEIQNYLDRTREVIIDRLGFTEKEKRAIDILKGNFSDNETIKIYLYFVFITIDYKFFISNAITLEDAIQGKFNFLLGLSHFNQISDISKKQVLFKILSLLREFCYHTYNVSSSAKIEQANKLLINLGVGLSIASRDTSMAKGLTSLSMECILDPLNPNKRFIYYVSDEAAELPEFKQIYDFYFKHESKEQFKSAVYKRMSPEEKAEIRDKNEYASETKRLNDRQKRALGHNTNIENMIEQYGDVLSKKLSNLKKRDTGML